MKKYILASILILTTYVGFAQPYFPVERGKKTYFQTYAGVVYLGINDSSATTPTAYTCENQLVTAPDKLFYNGTMHQLHSIIGISFSWVADTQIIFKNYLNKPIVLKLNAKINEQWLAYSDSNVAVYLKHTKDSVLRIDGTIDSTMSFKCSIQEYRLPPNDAPDYGNFMDITISKAHGIINAPDFYHFPLLSNEMYFNTIGLHLYMIRFNTSYMPNLYNITWDSIYRFNMGDEFHSKNIDRYSKQGVGVILDSIDEVKVVTQAQHYADSFVYTILQTNIGHRSTPLADSNWVTIDTVYTTYKHNNYRFLDKEPGVIYVPSSSLFTLITTNGTIGKRKVGQTDLHYQNDSVIYTTDNPVIDREIYINGCGGPYFQNKMLLLSHPPSQGITIKELVYYKKGTKTWGTPVSKTVGINEVNQPSQLFVYPNPAQNEVYINLKQQNGYFTLYNTVGVICFEQEISGQTKVNLSNLKSGLYYYTIKENSKVFNGKLIKE